jgi:hypothetical protein
MGQFRLWAVEESKALLRRVRPQRAGAELSLTDLPSAHVRTRWRARHSA